MELKGKTITLWLRSNGYRYQGVVLSEDEQFITLHDSKTGHVRGYNKADLTGWEVIEQ